MVTVAEVNQAPVLDPIADRPVVQGATLSFTATATDADVPTNSLHFSLDPGFPAGATIGATSGIFTWTPGLDIALGSYPITVRVTDDGTPALGGTMTFTIIVTSANQAPVLVPIADRTADEGSLVTFTAMASDPDGPADALRFSIGPAGPTGAMVDSVTGVFRWTPPDGPSDATITIEVADGGSPAQRDAQPFTIHVGNVAPSMSLIYT